MLSEKQCGFFHWAGVEEGMVVEGEEGVDQVQTATADNPKLRGRVRNWTESGTLGFGGGGAFGSQKEEVVGQAEEPREARRNRGSEGCVRNLDIQEQNAHLRMAGVIVKLVGIKRLRLKTM